MIFYIHTLGCKINQYESQSLRESWERFGHVETHDPLQAGVILINSCAVTSRAVQEVRQQTRKFHRDNPVAEIIITGCASDIAAEEFSSLPGVVDVVSQEKKSSLLNWPQGSTFDSTLTISSYYRTRGVLKVQDGCSQKCSFCIVPYTRGPSRSREPEAVIAEAKRLLHNGIRELTISGINLGHYQIHSSGGDFWDLLRLLDASLKAKWRGRSRLRISSLDPALLTDKALRTIASCELLTPHLHLSLQSGSPRILRKMNRSNYTPESVLKFTANLQSIWPVFGLGADILVGFPGEGEKDFDQTRDFVQTLPLSYGHVFPYSPRPLTAAAKFSGQTSPQTRKERAAAIRNILAAKKRNFDLSLCDREELQIIPEQNNRGRCEFYTLCHLAPPVTEEKVGSLITAEPLCMKGMNLLARPL